MNQSSNVYKLKNLKPVKNKTDFDYALNLFLDDSLKDERFQLYKEDIELGLSLPESKHNYLKTIFSDFIKESLQNALTLVNSNQPLEAKVIVDDLYRLKPIFKEYDILSYPKFISESDTNINEQEVELLFLEPIINKKEINKLTSAFINALSKKSLQYLNKQEFQEKFYNHPLLQCLNSFSDIKQIESSIESDTLQLGMYKDLIKVMIELKSKINAEEFQGFITFVISEDLTKGFSNILKDDCYKPKCLKDLLSYITVGKDLSHEVIKGVTEEIKLNHTKNFALDKSGELTQNISSNFSLNDYGFNVILNKYLNDEPKLFFHGHATENAGGNQREQQNNTAHILRDFKYDTLGLTVLKEHVANVEHHRRYLSKYSGLMSFTKMEELILSSLQFDASYFKTLSLEQNVHNIETSDLISSNQFIVKSDIKRSQQFIANSLNKKDLELICERKNAYCFLMNKNKDFFKQILNVTGTNNELSYQLIVRPFLDFTQAILSIEQDKEMKLFTKDDIILLQDVLSIKIPNADLSFMQQNINKLLKRRNENGLKDINVESYNDLINLGKNDISRNYKKSNDHYHEHTKFINNDRYDLIDVMYLLENNPLDEKYTKGYKTRVINALKIKIEKEAQELLLYRADKKEYLIENLLTITEELRNGNNIEYLKSDWSLPKDSIYSLSKTLAELYKTSNKSSEQISNDRILINGLTVLAKISGSKIICQSKDLDNKNKIKM